MTEAQTAGVRCSLSVHLVAAWRFSPVAGPFGAPAGQRRFAVAWARRASAAGSLYRVVAALALVGGVTGDPGGAGRGRCPGALPGGWRRAVARWWGHFSAPISGPQNGSAQSIPVLWAAFSGPLSGPTSGVGRVPAARPRGVRVAGSGCAWAAALVASALGCAASAALLVVELALVSAVARVSDRMLGGSAAPAAAETAAGAPRGRRARRGRPLARGGWSSGRGGPVWSWKPGVVYRSGRARIGPSVAAAAPRFPAGASKLAMGRRCASLVRMGRGCSGGARWKEMGRMIARVHMHSGGFGGFRAAGLSRGMEHGAAARRSDGDACCETGGRGGACSRCVSLAARSVIARDALLVWRS